MPTCLSHSHRLTSPSRLFLFVSQNDMEEAELSELIGSQGASRATSPNIASEKDIESLRQIVSRFAEVCLCSPFALLAFMAPSTV
jgi:hypothetical protein